MTRSAFTEPRHYHDTAAAMFEDSITISQPQREVVRQAKVKTRQSILADFPWLGFAALVLVFIAAFLALMHFDPIGRLAAYNFEGIDQ